jgi:hypothetical protein
VKDNEVPQRGRSQGVGQEIIKIIETNKLARWKTFDPKTREYEVESPAGIVKMHESEINKEFSLQEEADFRRSEHNSN